METRVARTLVAVTLLLGASGAGAATPMRETLSDGSQVQFDGSYYDFRAADGRKMVKMWVPPGVSPVRGMFITGHGGGSGDSRSFPRDPNFQAYAVRHGFAVVGLHYFPGRQVYDDGAGVFAGALNAFAGLGRHPEIAHLPFVVFGGSNGGATSYGLACALPERAIAFTPNAAAWWNPQTPSDAVLEVPGLFVVGLFDPFMRGTGVETTRQLVDDSRRRGSRWSFIAEEKGHEDGATWQLFTRFWDRSIELRLPLDADPSKGPVALRSIPEEDGWLVDMGSWGGGLTRIAPFAEYEGDRSAAGWVPDADTAFLYRSVATYDNPLVLSSRGVSQAFNPDTDYRSRLVGVADPPVAPGATVRLECDTTAFPDYERLEFYDGAELLGEIRAGEAPVFPVTVDGRKRVYNVTVLGHGKDGAVRASTPLYFYVTDPNVALTTAQAPDPGLAGDVPRGSRTATRAECAAAPDDHVLVAYGLTAEQERQFDAEDGQVAPFWKLIDENHDHVVMTQKDNAPEGNGFSVVIDNDARLLVKAAHAASGLYLYFEVTDNRFVDVADPNIYEHYDAVDALLDSRSSEEIGAGDREKTFVNVHWGISLTSSQYQVACGETSRPTRVKRNVADPWDMSYELIELTDLARRHGMSVDCAVVDKYRVAQEWFIPWSEVGNGGMDGEPPMGARLGFAPGYNDRDPGEYLDSGGHDQLRWVDRSSPWGHDPQKSAPPFGWGDIEIGPFLGAGGE